MCRTCNPEVTQGCRFDSAPGHCRVTTLGKLFTQVPLVTKQYNLGRWCPEAGKVTVGLVSHWPCVTDSSGLSTYGFNSHEWEMSTPPTPQLGHGSLYLLWHTPETCSTRVPRLALKVGMPVKVIVVKVKVVQSCSHPVLIHKHLGRTHTATHHHTQVYTFVI